MDIAASENYDNLAQTSYEKNTGNTFRVDTTSLRSHSNFIEI
jgi:hypothetical protein